MTYEELAELTGEPIREVNFYLPAYNIPLLQKLPGFEDFNPQTEVLHCDKPGTGLVDAPRAFSLKLRQVTEGKCKLVASSIDPELCFHHAKNPHGIWEVRIIMTKHVDDLKLTGRRDAILQVIQELQKVFGDLKVDWNEFTNCGVRHVQDPTTKEVTLDQHDYIKNMRPICHPQLKSSPDEDATPELHQLYMSLLGAVAYASQTRVDALVFICALQRHNSKPKVEHCVRLNKVLKWLQRTPKRLKYGRLVHNNTPRVSMEGEIPKRRAALSSCRSRIHHFSSTDSPQDHLRCSLQEGA